VPGAAVAASAEHYLPAGDARARSLTNAHAEKGRAQNHLQGCSRAEEEKISLSRSVWE